MNAKRLRGKRLRNDVLFSFNTHLTLLERHSNTILTRLKNISNCVKVRFCVKGRKLHIVSTGMFLSVSFDSQTCCRNVFSASSRIPTKFSDGLTNPPLVREAIKLDVPHDFMLCNNEFSSSLCSLFLRLLVWNSFDTT